MCEICVGENFNPIAGNEDIKFFDFRKILVKFYSATAAAAQLERVTQARSNTHVLPCLPYECAAV